jgi:hypothetical protein
MRVEFASLRLSNWLCYIFESTDMVINAASTDTIVHHLLPKWLLLYSAEEIRRVVSDEQTMQGIERLRNVRPMSDEEA